MKIVFLVPRFNGGGAEFVAVQWMEYLQSQGDEVIALTTNLRSADPKPENISFKQARGGLLTKVRFIRSSLKREQPDAVVALMPYWNLLAVFSTLGLRHRPRVIISGRNMATHLRGTFGMSYRLKQLLARLMYRHADEFVAISHPVAAEAIALYKLPPQRVSVVLNPSLTGQPEISLATRASDRPVAIVAPARLVRQKRPHLVIDTVAAYKRDYHHDAEAHFFGVGPLGDEVARHAERLGVVAHFHGWVPDWTKHLPENSVVLLPSLSEGFGNVLVQAAQAGVASVATSRALGVADAIVPGLTGVLVGGESPEDFALGVADAVSLNPSGYEHWLATFTREASGRSLRQRILALVNTDG